MKKSTDSNQTTPIKGRKKGIKLPATQVFPPSQDVFSQWENVQETEFVDAIANDGKLQEESTDSLIATDANGLASDNQEKSYGYDLDVPGADLDDQDENNGNEDEENNYYSIGGDRHNDLEEDQAGVE